IGKSKLLLLIVSIFLLFAWPSRLDTSNNRIFGLPACARGVAGWIGQPFHWFCASSKDPPSRPWRIMRHAASGGRPSSVEPDESAHVVGDIGKADFNPRAGQPDRSDKEGH